MKILFCDYRAVYTVRTVYSVHSPVIAECNFHKNEKSPENSVHGNCFLKDMLWSKRSSYNMSTLKRNSTDAHRCTQMHTDAIHAIHENKHPNTHTDAHRWPKLRCRTITEERHSACCYKVRSISTNWYVLYILLCYKVQTQYWWYIGWSIIISILSLP